jgi:hypothetical protein
MYVLQCEVCGKYSTKHCIFILHISFLQVSKATCLHLQRTYMYLMYVFRNCSEVKPVICLVKTQDYVYPCVSLHLSRNLLNRQENTEHCIPLPHLLYLGISVGAGVRYACTHFDNFDNQSMQKSVGTQNIHSCREEEKNSSSPSNLNLGSFSQMSKVAKNCISIQNVYKL